MSRPIPKAFLLGSVTFGLLTGCAQIWGSEKLEVRPVDTLSRLNTSSYDSLYEAAVSAIDARDYARALDYLQEARSRNPQNVQALNALGVVYDKLGRFDLSARYYAQARDIAPESQIVAENMAYSRVLQNMGAPSMAAPPAATVASIAPANVALVPISSAKAAEVAPVPTPAVANTTIPASVIDSAKAESAPPAPARPAGALPTSTVATSRDSVRPVPPTRVAEPAPAPKPIAISAAALIAPALSKGPKEAPRSASRVTPTLKPVAPAVSGSKPAAKIVLTTGQPLKIFNASGYSRGTVVLAGRLAKLGWTVRQEGTKKTQQRTVLLYPDRNLTVAEAMQRTLPFPIQLMTDNGAPGMQLIIGQGYLNWKPKNAQTAAQWQATVTVASLTKPRAGRE